MRLIKAGDDRFQARLDALTWQARKPQRVPERIVYADTSADVIQAIAQAGADGSIVSARSGGHSYHASAVRQGGVLVDLENLNHISVDPGKRTAEVGPAVTGAQLARALDRHGLAFAGPHDGRVPVAGFLLAGGIGLNVGSWGAACHSVTAIEVVTAGGALITANDEQHGDLLWAARGAGPGFPGIVTQFELELQPAPGFLRQRVWVYPISHADALAEHISSVLGELSPALELVLVVTKGPRGQVVIVRCGAWADSAIDAELMISPVAKYPRASAALVDEKVDLTTVSSFHELYARRHESPEHRRAVDAFWLRRDITTWFPTLAEKMRKAPSLESQLLVVVLPGLGAQVGRRSAFSAPGTYNVEPSAVWDTPDEDEENINWLRDVQRTLLPLAAGHYIASTDTLSDSSRTARAFSPESWTELELVRGRWDRDRLFAGFLTPDS